MKTLVPGCQIKFFSTMPSSKPGQADVATHQDDTVVDIWGNVVYTASGRIFSRLHRVPSEVWIATFGDFCVV